MSKPSYVINPDGTVTTTFEFEHGGKKKRSTTVTRNVVEPTVVRVFDKDGSVSESLSNVINNYIVSSKIVDI